MSTTKRNDPCPCGSGKKFKKCCMGKDAVPGHYVSASAGPARPEIKPQHREASECMARAISLHQAGKLDEAIENYRQVVAIKPDFMGAYFNLGLVFESKGLLDEAARNYRMVISRNPDNADACFNLGNILKKQGRPAQAIDCYRKALAVNPADVDAWFNMGNAFQDTNEMDAAAQSYLRAISLKPGYSEAHNNLGNTLYKQGRLQEAISSYRKAVACNASNAEAYNNMGNAFRGMGNTADAIRAYREAISIKPDYADAYGNLGNLYYLMGKLDDAILAYRKALALKPGLAEAYCGLASAFLGQNNLEEAVECNKQALLLKPDFVEVHSNLGNVLLNQGKLKEAIRSYRKALALKPDYLQAHENLLVALTHDPESSPAEYLAEARRYGDRVAGLATPYDRWPALDERGDERPLRVGFVSGDLRMHPVGFFLEGIVASLDPARVELVAYMTNLQEDSVTSRLRSSFSEWHSLLGMSDELAARRIRDDGIHVLIDLAGHVLIDLAGHTGHNRLPLFAWRPAPVQVSWLGYWASTGVQAMDYVLADEVSVPQQHRDQFTESIWCLPDTRLCYTPSADSMGVPLAPLPKSRNGYITFGSFQKLGKINDRVLALWGRVLHALPDAGLRVQNRQMNCPATREQFLERLITMGIAPGRVALEGEAPREVYLAAHAEVDIILDTFPFPGGTTTCEALWMGVPTLTLAGETMLGRQGASMLACTGLQDWIASDEADFVAKAIAHAADAERLAQLRQGLRDKVLASPLFDGYRFAQNLQKALHEMWQKKKAGS